MSTYMLLKDMRVQRMNIMQTPFIASACPVFACVMLGHMLAKRFDANDLGVGIVHHAAEPDIESMSNKNGWVSASTVLYRGATNESDAAPTGAPVIPAVAANARLSLIIKLDEQPQEIRAEEAVRSIRLAGGIVPMPPRVMFFDDLKSAIAACGRGFWLEDAADIVRQRLSDGAPPEEAVLTPVEAPGWYVPATIGYRRISAFAHRNGVRDGLKHAFAEALLGLVKYQSIYRLGETPSLWQYQWIGDRRAFVVFQPQSNQ